MSKKVWLLFFMAVSALLLAGKILVVKVMRANLLTKPDFLSSTMAPVENGAKLELLETQGSWFLVRNALGMKGYVHQTAVAENKTSLSGIIPGKKGASEEELALAAKGFNEGNEKKLRGSRGFNFADVDWIVDWNIANPAMAAFIREGKLK